LLTNDTFFYHPEVWDWWTAEAQSRENVPIHFVVHPGYGVPKEAVMDDVPYSMRQLVTVADSSKCRWGHTTPCMYQGLKTALETNHKSQFFAFASREAVPLKKFSTIDASLASNPRSRFAISDMNNPRSPKHHQWAVLNRKHAEILVANHDLWTDPNVCHFSSYKFSDGYKRSAADDEFCILRALSILHKNETAEATDYKMDDDLLFGYENYPSLWQEINLGIPPPRAVDGPRAVWDMSHNHTYVCWHACEEFGTAKRRNRPAVFDEVFERPLQDIVDDEKYWFGRKFSKECVVVLENNITSPGISTERIVDKVFLSKRNDDSPGNDDLMLLSKWLISHL